MGKVALPVGIGISLSNSAIVNEACAYWGSYGSPMGVGDGVCDRIAGRLNFFCEFTQGELNERHMNCCYHKHSTKPPPAATLQGHGAEIGQQAGGLLKYLLYKCSTF